MKLNGEFSTALKKQEDLSSNIECLKKNLAERENEICEIEVDIASCGTQENEHVEKIAEMRKQLTTMKQTLEDKCHDKVKRLEEEKEKKNELNAQVNHLKEEIAEKDRRIANLAKDEKDLRKKKELKKSEYNKKVQVRN